MKNKWTVAIVLGCIVFLVLAYWIGKSYGKSLPPKPIDQPEDLQDNGTVNASGTLSEVEIQQITDAFYKDINGWSWGFQHDMTPYQKFLSLSNTDKVKVLNDWNARYFSEWSQQLDDAISGEYYSSSGNAKLAGAVVDSIKKLT